MTGANYFGTMLITGNGFDLNLNMKTSYKDFFLLLESNGFWSMHKDNRLLSYIHEKGTMEYWYSFEEIIKEFALKSTESRFIVYYDRFLRDANRIQDYDNSILSTLSSYKTLEIYIPSVAELIKLCDGKSIIDPELSEKATFIVSKIESEFAAYLAPITKECNTAIDLLKEELNKFIKKARPEYGKYSAAAKILCALFGCDGPGAEAWNERLRNRYDELLERHNLPRFRFVTFNYTDPCLWLMHVIKSIITQPLMENISSMSERVYNIHGHVDENIAFGTDEDDNIPKELWTLRKCHYLETNTKAKFHQDLCNSKRIVIFGHSIQGIDYEYYEKFFKSKENVCDVYILGYPKESLNEIKIALELKGVSLPAKYIVANEYDNDFCELCDIINKEQSQA